MYHLYVMQKKVEAGLADAAFFADDVPKSVVIRLTAGRGWHASRLSEWAEERGLDLGEDTNMPLWDGTRPDYDWAVGAMILNLAG